ncbi:hypothetical protein [Natronomonas sp.]|uniref:hypothetical protein n=1 Tax=Natronomonas sp. TaxID=2184060 RepID=UPI002626DCC9|nr:hypothetical protein [Natronomonas sp.]
MIDHPRLSRTDEGEAAVSATFAPASEGSGAPARKTLVLSARASALLVDELGYDDREEIAPMTVRALLVTEGAAGPDGTTEPVALVQRLRHPDGGKRPTERELERVGAYLRGAEIERRVAWLARELVEDSRLSTVMDPTEVGTQRDRMNGLRGIAKDL